MSCANGSDCRESTDRRIAVGVLGLMLVIFLVLSAWSFLGSRVQAIPSAVHFADHDAVQGRRVFQAYNCMGCHTIVGNGAYFAPDLTKLYDAVGPAWLAAFLPSASGWPTSAAVQAQLQSPAIQQESGALSMDEYLARHPGAAERIRRRGGQRSLMPNLPFSAAEIGELIAFLKYTSSMNTEGWPPTPKVDGLRFTEARFTRGGGAAAPFVTAAAVATATTAAAKPVIDPVVRGAALTQELGCLACHSTKRDRVVGPGWGGLYGTESRLADGGTAKVDDVYLTESIRHPDTKLVAGYPAKVMPSYDDALINDADMDAIVAYLRSLQGDGK